MDRKPFRLVYDMSTKWYDVYLGDDRIGCIYIIPGDGTFDGIVAECDGKVVFTATLIYMTKITDQTGYWDARQCDYYVQRALKAIRLELVGGLPEEVYGVTTRYV